MNTTDKLTLKALQLKQTFHGGDNGRLLDMVIDQVTNKQDLRNICAFIHKDLFAQVEQVCSNLDLSKREFVEMAIIDFIEKADEIMERHNVFEGLDNQGEA